MKLYLYVYSYHIISMDRLNIFAVLLWIMPVLGPQKSAKENSEAKVLIKNTCSLESNWLSGLFTLGDHARTTIMHCLQYRPLWWYGKAL